MTPTEHESAYRKNQVASPVFGLLFFVILLVGGAYTFFHIHQDIGHEPAMASVVPYIMLILALLIALGFEFVNGFHDTANAVATVIYSRSLKPHWAVIWSGLWNFVGVMASSGGVAFTVVSLLPIELVLSVGSNIGFAMVFALLLSAILWNLATWYFGIPNSSSHTLIGSIIGVGLMNQILAGNDRVSGVDWSQAIKVFEGLVFSPIAGFFLASVFMVALRYLVRLPALYKSPEGDKPPHWTIRSLLIFTCMGVSFSHGSNDGQKGMGLIMLILIGTVPTAYALNGVGSYSEKELFVRQVGVVEHILNRVDQGLVPFSPQLARDNVTDAIQSGKIDANTLSSVHVLLKNAQSMILTRDGNVSILQAGGGNFRNDLYLINQILPSLQNSSSFSGEEKKQIEGLRKLSLKATQFIPRWVKVSVALALALGTMVGWKRIVITVGERIGKSHLTYGQGAVAETVAMGLIQAADRFHLPISTTHAVTSAVAGTMVANGSGLQWSTIKMLAMAWVLTLPAAITLSGFLFWLLRVIFV
ncbi:inorganic phosphate transporter [Entomobacter blattae]|nr:inorganic phosphate transporter [Entomobacter blattae]